MVSFSLIFFYFLGPIKKYVSGNFQFKRDKRDLLTQDLRQSFRSQVTGKHSVGKEFQSSAAPEKKTFDIGIIIISRSGGRKIMQLIRITSGPPTRKREWNQFSQFRSKANNLIPIGNTYSSCFSTVRQVKERERVRDQPFCLSFSVACLICSSIGQEHQPRYDNSMLRNVDVWQIYRDKD